MSNVDVRVLSEAFCGLDESDTAIQRLKVIIVLPQCSSSALNDPVSTIHSEHGGKNRQIENIIYRNIDRGDMIKMANMFCSVDRLGSTARLVSQFCISQ